MRINNIKFIWSVLIVLFTVTTIYPQGFSKKYRKWNKNSRGTGRITGIIKDIEGNLLKKAEILIVHEDEVSKFKTKSDKKGKWVLNGLGSGEFMINVSCEGYIPSTTLLTLSLRSTNRHVECILRKPKITVEDLKEKLKEAEGLYKEKEYDKALTLYNYVLEKAPKVYQIYYKVAECLRWKGEEKKAIERYEKGIEMALDREDESSAAEVLGIIGGMFQKKNDLKRAESYYRRALKIDPQDEVIAYNVAEFNFDLKKNMKINDAVKYYKLAIRIKPDWALPYKQIGYAYLHKNDRKNAAKMFKKYLKLNPGSKHAVLIKKIINKY